MLFLFGIETVFAAENLSSSVNLSNNYQNLKMDVGRSGRKSGRSGRLGRKSLSRKKKKHDKNDRFTYFLKSLVLPGWGEYSLGKKNEALFFGSTEIALIAAAIGLDYYSGVREDDYKRYARVHAGVDNSGKDEQYWINLGNFKNVDEYNQYKTNRREFGSRYENAEDAWYWDSDKQRKKFDEIRISAEDAETYTYYAIGGLVLNHLASAINASYEAGKIVPKVSTTINKDNKVKSKLSVNYNF